MTRLVGLGSIVVDLVLAVPGLPPRGGDVLAGSWQTAVGGGFTVLAAASAAGLPAAYGGGHGTGPFGDLVRVGLRAAGIPALLPPTPAADTGVCVVLVEPGGERTFATTVGAEGRLGPGRLAALDLRAADLVYVSGYDLAYPHAAAVAHAVGALPAATRVLFDPGPLVAEVDAGLLRLVAGRTSWLSLNAREAARWTGLADPAQAARRLLAAAPRAEAVVVRTGADGCVVARPGQTPAALPAMAVEGVLDSTGAGDVHVGTFAAGLAAGLAPVAAAAAANAAAARAVTRAGPG